MLKRMLIPNEKCLGALVLGFLFNACPSAPTSPPIVVADDIERPTTWSPSSGDCDVTVTKAQLVVKSDLTIEAGTKVCFQADTGLLVEKTGSLSAVGNSASRVILTGTSATAGYWKGLAILSNNAGNKLHFVDVTYAGSAESFCCGFFVSSETIRAGLLVGDYGTGGLVSVQNSLFAHSAGMGLFAFEDSRLTGFTANTFSGNALAPVGLPMLAVNDLDAASVYSGGAQPNGKNVVRVFSYQKPSSPVTMKKLSVPYAMGDGFADRVFDFGANLTIEAGAKLEFEANTGLKFESTAQLTINGTATERVVLTGRSPTAGFWKGVAVMGLTNVVGYTDITFAGNDDSFCCGFFEPGGAGAKAAFVVGDYATTGAATLNNVNVTQSKNRGVAVIKGTLTQTGTNDLATGNGASNLIP